MELGKRIRALRQEKGLSQEALAERLGISRQAVVKWEHGTANPSTANLIALSQILEVPLAELVSGKAEEAEPPKRRSRLPLALSIVTLALAVLTLLALLHAKSMAVPTGIIGYADGPTAVFVTGIPVPLSLLAGLTILAALATLAAFVLLRKRKG